MTEMTTVSPYTEDTGIRLAEEQKNKQESSSQIRSNQGIVYRSVVSFHGERPQVIIHTPMKIEKKRSLYEMMYKKMEGK